MFGITPETRVFVKTGVTDGRLGYEGLRGLTVKVIEQSPQSGHLFCFCNGARNRIRLLWFDGAVFFIATKRLDRGTFDFPNNEMAVARMNLAQLQAKRVLRSSTTNSRICCAGTSGPRASS